MSRRCRAGGLKRSFGEKVTNVLELCFEQRGLVQKQPSTPCPPRGPLALYIHTQEAGLNMDPDQFLRRIHDQDVKDRLRAYTDEVTHS